MAAAGGARAAPRPGRCRSTSPGRAGPVRPRRRVRALLMSRTAPSGWLQAPRPFTWPSQRRSSGQARRAARGQPLELARRSRPGRTGRDRTGPADSIGQVAGHPGGLGQPAGVGGQGGDQARRPGWRPTGASPAAENGSGRAAAASAQRAEVAADQQAPERRRCAAGQRSGSSRTGVPMAISWTQGSRTAPRTVTSMEPGSAARAGGAEPGGAVPGDERQVGQGLDVLHQRRPSAQAARRQPRWCRGGGRDAALDPVHDGAGLAGDEPVGGRHAPGSGPGRCRPGGARRAAVVDDLADRVVHHDHGLAGADELGGERRAVQDQVRRSGPAGPCPWRWRARPRCRWR